MQKQIEYGDFRIRLQEKVQNRPLFAQMALTFRCNLKCPHCYVGNLRNTPKQEEMDIVMIKRIINQLYDAGFLWLSFTGGEPLLRDDFADIYKYAKEKGFIVIILTNGTLINEQLIEFFKQYMPFYLDITIHAAEPKIYDRISGIRGSFNNLIKNIKLLQKNKIPFKLKTTVMTLNLGQLSKIRNFAKEINAPFMASLAIHARLDQDKTPLSLRLTPRQIAAFFKENHIEEGCNSIDSNQCQGLNKNPLFRCGVMSFSVVVDPFGNLICCEYLRQPSFDLKRGSFKEGYEYILNVISNSEFKIDSKCAVCKIWDVCAICPGISFLESGNWGSPVEYFCQVARIRNEQRKKYFVESC